jgi:hypothetical protein
MTDQEYTGTNIFEKALLERYEKLGIGEPDARVMEAVRRAADIVTGEVKELLNEKFDLRQSRRKKLMSRRD